MAMLEINNLGISFGGLRAVDDFNITIEKGCLYGLIGPNGAGKTTVFNLLTGVYKPSEGIIKLDGKNITGKPTIEINKAGIARTFQNIRLFGKLTVAANVRIAMHSQRQSSAFDAVFHTSKFRRDEDVMTAKVRRLLGLFGLAEKEEELASNLPYGEQRKLEICRALASNPSLLLLDEPAAGMNPQETKELMELIAFIRDEFKLTILLIEHDMKLVMGICERLYVLNYGRVLASGSPDEIKTDPQVINAYLGSEAESLA